MEHTPIPSHWLHITVPSHWLALAHHSLDAQFWLRVAARLRAHNYTPANATDEQVRAAIAWVEKNP